MFLQYVSLHKLAFLKHTWNFLMTLQGLCLTDTKENSKQNWSLPRVYCNCFFLLIPFSKLFFVTIRSSGLEVLFLQAPPGMNRFLVHTGLFDFLTTPHIPHSKSTYGKWDVRYQVKQLYRLFRGEITFLTSFSSYQTFRSSSTVPSTVASPLCMEAV